MKKTVLIIFILTLFIVSSSLAIHSFINNRIDVFRSKIEQKLVVKNLDYTIVPLQIMVDEVRTHSSSGSLQLCTIPLSFNLLTGKSTEISLFCESGNALISPKQMVKREGAPKKKRKTIHFLKNYHINLFVNHFTASLKNISRNMPLELQLSRQNISARWGTKEQMILLHLSLERQSFSVDFDSIEASFLHKGATISAKVGGWCRGEKKEDITTTCDIYCKNIRATHPTLDSTALHLPFLRIQGDITLNRATKRCFIKKGRLSLGSLSGGFTISCRENDFDLSLFSNHLGLADLSTIIDAPQLHRYRTNGEIVISIASIGTLSPLHVEDIDIDGDVINPVQESDRLDWLLAPFTYHALLADGSEKLIAVNSLHSNEFLLIDLLPIFVPWSLVLSEDAGFYRHHGVDFAEINQVALEINKKKRLRGGSTITQQLAKNLLLTRDRTFVRKFNELLLAIEIDATLSKRRQLNIYLAIVEWAPGVYGIENAAKFYFGKGAESLTVLEAAYLATIISCPTKCSVHFYKQMVSDSWMKRVYRIVELLYQHEKISTEEYVRALDSTIYFRPLPHDKPPL
ncbi:penicillin-binding protein [bacterium]|nr:penicillin-binding protein [bacterium]